jgi:hypothetical protein
MRRPTLLVLIALLAGVLTLVALPAAGQVRAHHAIGVDSDEPNLDDALYAIELAEGHEDGEDDALTQSLSLSGYVVDDLRFAIEHLVDAIAAVNDSESAGEISAATADTLKSKLNEAIGADGEAITQLAKANPSGAQAAFCQASRSPAATTSAGSAR